MSSFDEQLRRGVEDVNRRATEAVKEGGLEAGIRVGFDQALEQTPAVIEFLQRHGFEGIEPGSYLLASLIGGLVQAGINPVDAVHNADVYRLLLEYVERARQQ